MHIFESQKTEIVPKPCENTILMIIALLLHLFLFLSGMKAQSYLEKIQNLLSILYCSLPTAGELEGFL